MSRYEEVLNEILIEYKETLEGVFKRTKFQAANNIEQTESPIEKLLYIQMKHDIVMDYREGGRPPILIPQFKIKKDKSYIRVDFLLEVFDARNEDKSVKIVIECDGHDFHEKTKEQAQKDKSRDRFLLNEGYYVLRFTGSEIHRNPRDCTTDINNLITEKLYGDEIRNGTTR